MCAANKGGQDPEPTLVSPQVDDRIIVNILNTITNILSTPRHHQCRQPYQQRDKTLHESLFPQSSSHAGQVRLLQLPELNCNVPIICTSPAIIGFSNCHDHQVYIQAKDILHITNDKAVVESKSGGVAQEDGGNYLGEKERM